MKQRKIARIVLALAVVLALTMTELTPLSMVQEASAVTQADIDKLKDELSGMNSEKAQLEKELKSIQNNKNTALAQKENIDKQINLLQSEIKNVESLISEYETLIEQTEQEIRENEEEEKRQYEKFCARVRSMEERGTVSYWSVLFNAASFTDLLSAMDFISEIMDSDQKVIDDLRALREQIEQKKATLEASLAEQQTAKETLVTKKNELNTQRAAAEKVLADLKANEAQYKQVLSEKDAAMERQQAEIVRLSRELAAKNGDTTATLGGYIWPCSSRYITSPLGARYTGIAGASTNHAGIDIGRGRQGGHRHHLGVQQVPRQLRCREPRQRQHYDLSALVLPFSQRGRLCCPGAGRRHYRYDRCEQRPAPAFRDHRKRQDRQPAQLPHQLHQGLVSA